MPATLAATLILCGSAGITGPVSAEPALAMLPAADDPARVPDEYQRASKIYHFNWFEGSESSRGEELYFFKCWICHNPYTTRQHDPGRAPALEDLFQRPALLSGRPVSDEEVARTIREGSRGMPGYGHDLNDTDIAELVRYLREDCCWDEDKPPANPLYRARSE